MPSFARTGKDHHRRNNDEQAGYPSNPSNLNGDVYLSGVMGKNLACNAEEQSGYPPTLQPKR
jgi:hypothetical protein